MNESARADIVAVCIGRISPLGTDGTLSAIARSQAHGPVPVGVDGLEGDEHADSVKHGGPDKAVLYYPIEHHRAWRDVLPEFAPLPGAFGENVLGRGLVEYEVCLGDVFASGNVTLEVSQPRQPCFKLDRHLGVAGAARTALATGRTGFYLRVRVSGRVEAGDRMRLLSRPHPDWPLERARRVYLNRIDDRGAAQRLACVPALSSGWRERLLVQGP